MRVLFVGDEPSSKNINPEIAFIGTKSYDRLLEWTAYMQVNEFEMINRVDKNFYNRVDFYFENGNPVIALGAKAEHALKNIAKNYEGGENFPNYWSLPHPSGRNYLLNDKVFVRNCLDKCKKFLDAIDIYLRDS